MSQFFKGIALFIGVCCLVWVGVLWRWQATQRDMSSADIVLYLGLLPVVLFTLLVLGRWAFGSASARADARAAAAAAATVATAAGSKPTQASGDAAARHTTVQLLTAQLYTPAGEDLNSLDAACAEGQPRPAPDAELRDDDGMPVMCARAAELPLDDTEALWEQALQTTRATQPEWAALEPDEAVRRAVAALDAPLRQSLFALMPWSVRLGLRDGKPEPRTDRQTERHDNAPMLRVLPAWPTHWSEFERAVARAVLQATATDVLTGIAAPQRVVWMADHLGGASSQWLAVDALFQAMQREQRDDLVLVTACHCDLSAARVEQLQREQRLFTGQSQRAQMPGEAAAAVVLAGSAWPADPEADTPPVHLHRPAVAHRDKPVDGPGKVSSAVLETVAGHALEAAGVAAAEVATLCSDADQHTARATELFGAMLSLLPHLDAVEDTRLAGPMLGRSDATAVLITIALAAQQAGKREQASLALSLDDPQARLALVARPAPPTPAAPTPPAAT